MRDSGATGAKIQMTMSSDILAQPGGCFNVTRREPSGLYAQRTSCSTPKAP